MHQLFALFNLFLNHGHGVFIVHGVNLALFQLGNVHHLHRLGQRHIHAVGNGNGGLFVFEPRHALLLRGQAFIKRLQRCFMQFQHVGMVFGFALGTFLGGFVAQFANLQFSFAGGLRGARGLFGFAGGAAPGLAGGLFGFALVGFGVFGRFVDGNNAGLLCGHALGFAVTRHFGNPLNLFQRVNLLQQGVNLILSVCSP